MAPATRASAKGHVFQTKSTTKGSRGKKPKDSKKLKDSKEADPTSKTPDVKDSRCLFLELPPEIRNRIYHFAKEKAYKEHAFNSDGWEPPLLAKTAKSRDWGRSYSARKFFALTQTCKQIRSEFRPLWLRNSSLRIELANVKGFISTFYPKIGDYQNAPKLLLVSWDHDEDFDEDVLYNITPLLRLRASCPTFTAEFVCRRLVEGGWPNLECEECGHSIHCSCDDSACEHEDTVHEYISDMHMMYSYMSVLDEFLANSNEAWLQTIREDVRQGMTVECTVDIDTQRPTIYIRFMKGRAPAIFKKKDMFHSAVRYLNKMGILDLPQREQLDFVVGEGTGKYTRHSEGCGFPVPTYNQVHMCGHGL